MMAREKLCPICGASRRIVREHLWLNDGTIVQKKNRDHRMVFIETHNIASTFSGVEEIIGMSIEHIIVESKRRATFDFVDHMLPGIVKAVVRLVGIKPVVRDISKLGSVMGYGDIRMVDIRRVHDQGDYATMSIKEPYSLPLFCGDVSGTFNATDRREVNVTYEEKAADEYDVTAHISKHPLALQERLKSTPYTHKEGNVNLERCHKCGGPMVLSEYKWHLERGVIENRNNSRRMSFVGPAALDAIIVELEKELGDSIPRVIIEAQRRFIRTGFYSLDEIATEELFRMQLAIRGLGNLREIQWMENRLNIRLENPCLPIVIVGLIQGFFELASGRTGEVEWELEKDGGSLSVEVSLED
jgi:hypothetical protein